MTPEQKIIVGGTVLAAIGLWWLLPGSGPRLRLAGGLFGLAGLGLFGAHLVRSYVLPTEHWVGESTLVVLAGTTVISAVGAITMRSPVYCAMWFALTLLGTAGLFLFQGAQFLGIATVVVYAGAILVTFLFVLMLAQPQGHDAYDRVSWEAMLSACAGAVLVGILTLSMADIFRSGHAPQSAALSAMEKEVLAGNHVERLGEQLFSRHLLAVEVAGTLLTAALVGAIAMVGHGRERLTREEQPHV